MFATNAKGIAGGRIPLNDIAERLRTADIGISVDGNVLVARQDHCTSRIVIVPPDWRTSAVSRPQAVVRVITPLPHELMAFLDDARFLSIANRFASLGAVTVSDSGARVESRLSVLAGDESVWESLHLPLLAETLRYAAQGPLATLGRARETDEVGSTISAWTDDDFGQMERCLSLVSPCFADGSGFSAEFNLVDLFGDATDDPGMIACFRADTTKPHPELGAGLSCTLEMQHRAESEHQLHQLCARLNALEMAARDLPPHFGAWTKGRHGTNPAYVSFYPNSMHSIPRLGVNAAFWALSRARWASDMLPSIGLTVAA